MQQLDIEIEPGADPFARGAIAAIEDGEDEERQHQQQQRRRDERRDEQVVVGRVHDDGDRPAGHDGKKRPLGFAVGDRFREHRDHRRRRAVQDSGSQSAHDPQRHRRIADIAKIAEVLEDREAGAHGEALHRRIDHEADTPPENEERDEERLRGFLGDRRNVTGQDVEVDRRGDQPYMDGFAHDGADHAVDQCQRHRRGPDQLEAVHQQQRAEEDERWKEGDGDRHG